MGMYDNLKIAPELLQVSEQERELLENSCQGGFQTKSLHNMLYLVEIAEDGKLRWSIPDWLLDQDEDQSESDQSQSDQLETDSKWTDEPVFTGEVRFYDSIGGIRYEFCALYALGELLRIVRITP